MNCKVRDEQNIVVAVNSAANLGNNISKLAMQQDIELSVLSNFVLGYHASSTKPMQEVLNSNRALLFSQIMKLCTILSCKVEDLIE